LADVELVVEVRGRLPEVLGDVLVEVERRLDDLRDQLHQGGVGVEHGLQVAVEEGFVDDRQRHVRRHRDVKSREVALQPRVDLHAAGRRIQRGDVLALFDGLHRELADVVPVPVVQVLPHERDGRLRVVLVELRQVEVVDEVDHVARARRPVQRPGLLLQDALQRRLEHQPAREEVHVDRGIQRLLRIQLLQLAHDRLRLARAAGPREHGAVVVPQ